MIFSTPQLSKPFLQKLNMHPNQLHPTTSTQFWGMPLTNTQINDLVLFNWFILTLSSLRTRNTVINVIIRVALWFQYMFQQTLINFLNKKEFSKSDNKWYHSNKQLQLCLINNYITNYNPHRDKFYSVIEAFGIC